MRNILENTKHRSLGAYIQNRPQKCHGAQMIVISINVEKSDLQLALKHVLVARIDL